MKYFLTFLLISFNCFAQPLYDKRIKIAVVDSGVSLEQSKQNFMCHGGILTTYNDNGIDQHGHGTNIISIISSHMDYKKMCIVSIKVYRNKNEDNGLNYITGLTWASIIQPKFTNISMVGYENILAEFVSIKKILENGGVVNVASGNEFKDLSKSCFAFPACYRNLLPRNLAGKFNVVGSKTTNGNFNGPTNVYLDGKDQGFPKMSGTSQATALMTSFLISK